MSKQITKENKKYFVCRFCSRAYRNEQMADLCEKWCSAHHKPNEEITQHGEKLD